jgi:hypothetical protein
MGNIELRDYLASQAMAGDQFDGNGSWSNCVPKKHIIERVRLYYRIADAMMEVRSEEQPI